MHYAIQLGVRTYHKYMSMACATSCTVLLYYSVHGIPGIETVYMCLRDVQQREICEKIVTLLQQ
jgi:hypothetical protein